MAVSSGAGQHLAWLIVNGQQFPIERGSAEQTATRKSGSFSASLPLWYPGALDTLAALGPNQASVSVLTRGQTATLMSGEIDTVEPDFIAGTLSVTGRPQSALLHATKSSEKWANMPGSQIVTQLAGRVGLGAVVDPSPLPAGKQVQNDWAKMTDDISLAAVIHKLAEYDGARWWVNNGTLYYRLLNNPAGNYALNFTPPTNGNPASADFMSLRIRRNVQAGKDINVTVKSWNPRNKQVFQGTSNVAGSGGSQNYVYHIPNLNQEAANQHAKSKAKAHSRHELTVSAKVVGDPSIDVSMGLQVNGTTFFDQVYEIDGIHHDFGMTGHTMSITARSPKEGRQASGNG
jgi:hypothetical protein